MSYDIDIVRTELVDLMNEFPDRYGTLDGEDPRDNDDSTCVYFADPLEGMNIPVCIVGMWIDRFHPELKTLREIQSELSMNCGVDSWDNVDYLISDEVIELLSVAQMQQDQGKTWGKIDLGKSATQVRYRV